MKFNPKVSEFLKENEDVTVIGLYWAGYWRLAVIILGCVFVLGVFGMILEN